VRTTRSARLVCAHARTRKRTHARTHARQRTRKRARKRTRKRTHMCTHMCTHTRALWHLLNTDSIWSNCSPLGGRLAHRRQRVRRVHRLQRRRGHRCARHAAPARRRARLLLEQQQLLP
jgi:hypothetical protein